MELIKNDTLNIQIIRKSYIWILTILFNFSLYEQIFDFYLSKYCEDFLLKLSINYEYFLTLSYYSLTLKSTQICP